MAKKRRELALRRLSRWQQVKVQVVSKRASEADGIVEGLTRRLSDLQAHCADAEAHAFDAAFSLGPQQALAAIRHSQTLRSQCDDLEKKTASAKEIVEELHQLRARENALRRQAEQLADKHKAERRLASTRRETTAIEEMILARRGRGGKK